LQEFIDHEQSNDLNRRETISLGALSTWRKATMTPSGSTEALRLREL
jgi:hypothetical protein